MYSYDYTCGLSAMMRKMCIILLISIITETLENSFSVLPIRFLVVACNNMNLKLYR